MSKSLKPPVINKPKLFFWSIVLIVSILAIIIIISNDREPQTITQQGQGRDIIKDGKLTQQAETIFNNYTVDGDKVYWNDNKVYFVAYPHTINKDGYVYFNMTSKIYAGDIDLTFGFDTDKITPVKVEYYNPRYVNYTSSYQCDYNFNYTTTPKYYWCYKSNNITGKTEIVNEGPFDWGNIGAKIAYKNYTRYEEYQDINKLWDKVNYDYGGVNTWYYARNLNINSNQEYALRVTIRLKPNNFNPVPLDSKYWIAFKPSTETIQQAISNEHFYALDPWINSTGGNANYNSLDTGLLHYYKFDEGTGSVSRDELLLNQYNVTNVPHWNNTGIISYSLESVSDSTARTLNGSIAPSTGPFSISFWISPYDVTGTTYRVILDTRSSRQLIIYVRNSMIQYYPDGAHLESGPALTSGIWQNIVLVNNGSTSAWYLNGTNTVNNSAYDNIPSTTETLYTHFAEGYDGSQKYGGRIDEVGFWNKTLNSSDVTALYNGGLGIQYNRTAYVPPPLTGDLNISLISPTNGYISNNTNVNFTCYAFTTSNGILNVTLKIQNTTTVNITNTTDYQNLTLSEIITMVPNFYYNWSCTASTRANYTESPTRWFYIDQTAPIINITYPLSINYNINVTTLNYTYYDASPGFCYAIVNGANLSTVPAYTNFSGINPIQGLNNFNLTCNDSFGQRSSKNVSFFLDSIPPNITIKYPLNTSYNISITSLNYTIKETNLNSCWYSLNGGSNNVSIVCGNNLTGLTANEGSNIWSVYANDTVNNIAQGNITFLIDTIPPIINITNPANTTYTDTNISVNRKQIYINWTISDPVTPLSMCKLYNGSTNITVSCLNLNYTQNITYGSYQFILWANDTLNNANQSIISATYNYKVFEHNQSYISSVYEGSFNNFSANFSLGTGYTLSKAFLYYNRTFYPAAVNTIDGNIITTSGITAPGVSTNQLINFTWQLTLNDGSTINLTSFQQGVKAISADNCGVLTKLVYNFSVFDEKEQTFLNTATIETEFNIYSADNNVLVYNNSWNVGQPISSICIVNDIGTANYSFNVLLKYYAPSYATEYYNIQKALYINSTAAQQIKLYDLNSSQSTDFQLTFTGSDFLPVENALIIVNRQYIPEGIFKTVELPKTDSNGQTIIHLVRNDILYNLIIIKDNQVLGSYNNIVAFCDDLSIGNCKLNFNGFVTGQPIFDYNNDLGIIFSKPTFNNDTKIISFDFSTNDGTSKTVSMQVIRNDAFGNRTVCNDSLTSSSGTLSCALPSTIEDSLIKVNVYSQGQPVTEDYINIKSQGYGKNGNFLFFIFILAFMLLFAKSKNTFLIGIFLGFITSVVLGFVNGLIIGIASAGGWLLVILIIAFWKINKSKES